MRNPRSLLLVLFCALGLAAAAPPAAPPVGPALQAGEALALAGPDGTVYTYGDTRRELPMGNLALLVWLRLEGQEWGAMAMAFNCTGVWRGVPCWRPKGHGKEDLGKALQEDCRLAFLAWGQMSAQAWLQDYGEGAARARLDDIFGPFEGNRVPGVDLPPITPEWFGFGAGNLLRTSPEAMARWLVDPSQEQMVRQARRLLVGNGDPYYDHKVWWIQAGTAPEPGASGASSVWAVGGNGEVLAVLHLPVGRTRADGYARFRTLLIPPAPPK